MTVPANISVGTLQASITYTEDQLPVQQSALYFPVNNDVQVQVQYPTIADGTGCQSEFYYKADRTTPDTDPSTVSYAVPVIVDPDNPGATMSSFIVDASDNAVSGAFWWRIDFLDAGDNRTSVGFGPLIVEAV